MRVLIVVDEPSIRKTTRIALKTAGHSAAEAATAARALKAVADEAFEVVFLDLDLGAQPAHHAPPRRDIPTVGGRR